VQEVQAGAHSKNDKNNWKNCGRRMSFNRF
jgi:hypothetical protein